jgi:Ferritin-like domain
VSNQLSVEVFDREAALPDAFDHARRQSRGALMRKAGAAGGTLAVGGFLVGALPSFAAAKPSRKQDHRIFTFLLELEELQAAFYAEALSKGALDGELRQFAEVVGAHERRHVTSLRKAMGRRSAPARRRSFGATTTDPNRFIAAATALEDTVVAAYNGQGPNLTRSGLATAARIVSVEARHAAWIRAIAKEIPAPVPNDPTKTEKQALGTLTATGFLD